MKNAFFDAKAKYQLSGLAMSYIGGVLKHARAIAAITNPLVNSYKRLVPGYEAPVNVAWSERNRSPMVRIPARRGMGTRCEVRIRTRRATRTSRSPSCSRRASTASRTSSTQASP